MKNKSDSDLIREFLDGDLSGAAKREFLDRVREDEALRGELDDLASVVERLEREGRAEPPPGFTASVMARLPARKPSLGERMRWFWLGGRVLRWNMASAAVLVAVLVAAGLLMLDLTGRDRAAFRTAGPQTATTVMVRLTFEAPGAHRVAVAGDFNKWRTNADVMVRENGAWTIDLPLKPGVYTYMFIVDDKRWETDPSAPAYRADGFGHQNAVMRVGI